jgi:signal transduction histidine kinase/ActR/RegA family two-component response regulator
MPLAPEHTDLALNMGNVLVWRAEVHSSGIEFNAAALALLGLPPEQPSVSRAHLRALIHPEDLATFVNLIDRATNSAPYFDDLIRFTAPNGAWRHILMRRMLLHAASGEVASVLGIGLEVSARLASGTEPTLLAQRMEAASRAAGIGFVILEPGNPKAIWDAQMRHIHGLAPQEAPPSTRAWLRHHLPPAEAKRLLTLARTALRGSEPAILDLALTLQHRNGQQRYVRLHAQAFRRNGKAVVGLLIDETERVVASRALHAAQERAAIFASTVGLGTWEIDFEKRSVTWDEQMWRLRGLPFASAHPAPEQIYEGVHANDVSMLREQLRLGIREQKPLQYQYRVHLPNGQLRWLASRSMPVANAKGEITGRLGLNWDVTEARQAELTLREKDEAQRNSHAKSEFLARMSHELRTPLNAILGFTQMLQADGESVTPNTRQRRLERIRSAGQHLLSLINDVLEYSSLETSEIKVCLGRVDLGTLLLETLPLVDSQARQRRVKVRSGLIAGTALADATRLKQVLLNLLTNAIKYNREGGTVTVEAEPRGRWVLIRIQDTGLGMSDVQLRHLFEPFNRLGRESLDSDGTGIGLSIVKTLVERMGGSIHVDSTPQVGSMFELRLPSAGDETPPLHVMPELEQRHVKPTSKAPAHGVLKQVLYIEDNVVNALIMTELMQRRTDVKLHIAVNGADGVRMATELQPALVLVDMQLPDFDGKEVLRRLREGSTTTSLPCIAVSANALRQDIDAAIAAGFAEYWTKPLDFTFFFQSMDRLFGAQPAV